MTKGQCRGIEAHPKRRDAGTPRGPEPEPRALARAWGRIALALAAGTALAGCGPGPIITDDDADDGNTPTDADGTSSASATSGGGPTTTTTVGSASSPPMTSVGPDSADEVSGDDGPHFDVGQLPDMGLLPSDCFERPIVQPGCDTPPLLPDQQLGMFCVPESSPASCDGIMPQDVEDEAQWCLECGGFVDDVVCGPLHSEVGTCCFWFVYSVGPSCPGRPFTVEGHARLPEVVARGNWAEDIALPLDELDPALRRRLAEGWAQDGCFEHASIASFARFVMELLAVGAPASLVAEAQQALGEEHEHARAFFGLASAYGGHPVGPGALDVRDALAGSHDPVSIAEALVREGCIGETISSLQLQVAAARASDPTLRARLEVIAEQELRHAALAWSALAWLMARGDDRLRARVAQTFAEAARFVPRAADASDDLPEALLHAHGRLGADERLALAQRALERLVAPAAARLLEPWTVEAPAPAASTSRSRA